MGYVLAGMAFIALGICMLKWPRVFWHWSHGWTFENPKEAELSTGFMLVNFLNAMVIMLVGVIAIVFGLLGYK